MLNDTTKKLNDANLPVVEPNYELMLEKSLVTITDELEKPPVCLEIFQYGSNAVVGTLGNFSLVIGKAKQGKTFVISMALAAAESGMPFSEVLSVSLPFEKNKIILFDTEQSKYHVQKVLKRICKMAGKTVPNNLFVYSLRSRTPAERLKMIEIAIHQTNNTGLVVIDGIRDLVTSINDEEQSTIITSKLLKWTEELGIHIITVLHMNKGDANARGHIGTELTNKSETVISVAKSTDDKNVAIVKAEYCREKEFEPWAFKIDEFGIPSILKNWLIIPNQSKPKTEGFSPAKIPREKHIEIIKKILKADPDRKFQSLKASLINEMESYYGGHIPTSRINDLIAYYLDNKIMYKEGKPPQTKYRISIELPFTTTD